MPKCIELNSELILVLGFELILVMMSTYLSTLFNELAGVKLLCNFSSLAELLCLLNRSFTASLPLNEMGELRELYSVEFVVTRSHSQL